MSDAWSQNITSGAWFWNLAPDAWFRNVTSAWRLAGVRHNVLKSCVWRVSDGHLAQCFEITRQAQCFKIRRQAQNFKIFHQAQFSDFRNVASGGRLKGVWRNVLKSHVRRNVSKSGVQNPFQNLPPDAIFSDYASDVYHEWHSVEGTCSIFDTRFSFTFNDPNQIYSASICLRSLDQRQKHAMMVPDQIKIEAIVIQLWVCILSENSDDTTWWTLLPWPTSQVKFWQFYIMYIRDNFCPLGGSLWGTALVLLCHSALQKRPFPQKYSLRNHFCSNWFRKSVSELGSLVASSGTIAHFSLWQSFYEQPLERYIIIFDKLWKAGKLCIDQLIKTAVYTESDYCRLQVFLFCLNFQVLFSDHSLQRNVKVFV